MCVRYFVTGTHGLHMTLFRINTLQNASVSFNLHTLVILYKVWLFQISRQAICRSAMHIIRPGQREHTFNRSSRIPQLLHVVVDAALPSRIRDVYPLTRINSHVYNLATEPRFQNGGQPMSIEEQIGLGRQPVAKYLAIFSTSPVIVWATNPSCR
jgi:hypothetical protein